jgi:hypothetical protein
MRNAETVGIIAAAAQMGRSRCTIFDGPPLSRIFELGACRWHGIVLWGSVERSAVVSVRLSGGCKSLHDLVDAGFKFGDRQRFLKKRKWAWVLKLRLIMIDKRLLKESQSRGALLRAFYYTAVIRHRRHHTQCRDLEIPERGEGAAHLHVCWGTAPAIRHGPTIPR